MIYLGLDLGSVTCGVSHSDTGFLASPLTTIRFKPNDYDSALDQLLVLVQKEKPDLIVLGWPLLENGDRGERAQISEEFGEVLEQESGVKVVLQDERNTTKESEEILIMADVSRKKRKKVIDRMAAVRILQYYLDANQKKAIENAVFNYWGGNQDILQSTYTENQWNAYFESEIEPFFIQLEEVLTNMLYDINQQMNGNGIKISSDHLRYANNETKITMAKEFFDRGMVTTNGALEIVDMPPISNGDIRYIRAEYVNAETGQPVRDNIGKEVDNDNGSETTVNGNDSDSGGGSSE